MHTLHRLSPARVFILLLSVFAMTACKDSPSPSAVPICRLDTLFPSYLTLPADAKEDVLDSLHTQLDAMFRVMGTDTVTTLTLDDWCRSQVVRVFQPEVDRVYPSLDSLSLALGGIVANARADSLGLPDMQFVTVTWGVRRPLVRVDTIMLIALNHYLGADYAGYSGWPQFSRADKSPRRLPYDIAAALAATQYPAQMGDHPTLLAWMLYEGALVEARMRLVPDAELSEALGYTPDQLDFVKSNLKTLWGEMAAQRLIYSTDPLTIERYLDPSPSTPLLEGKSPGRVARYVGYEIVKSYIKHHPDASLRSLLSPDFYNSDASLVDSGFAP